MDRMSMGSGASSPGSRFRVDMAPDTVGPCSPVLSNHHNSTGCKSPSMVASPHPSVLPQSPPPLETVPEMMNGTEYSDGPGSTGSHATPPIEAQFRPPPLSQGVPSIELPEGKLSQSKQTNNLMQYFPTIQDDPQKSSFGMVESCLIVKWCSFQMPSDYWSFYFSFQIMTWKSSILKL